MIDTHDTIYQPLASVCKELKITNQLIGKTMLMWRAYLDPELTPFDKLLIMALLLHYNIKDRLCCAGEGTIAKNSGISLRQVKRSIKHLKELDWIQTKRRYQNSQIYDFNFALLKVKVPHRHFDSESEGADSESDSANSYESKCQFVQVKVPIHTSESANAFQVVPESRAFSATIGEEIIGEDVTGEDSNAHALAHGRKCHKNFSFSEEVNSPFTRKDNSNTSKESIPREPVISTPKESIRPEDDISTPKESSGPEPAFSTPRVNTSCTTKESVPREDNSNTTKESVPREPTSKVPMVHNQIDILPPDKHNTNKQENKELFYSDIPNPANEYAFTQFWFIYPRKVSKKPARRIFDHLVSKQGVAPEMIIAGAKRYAEQTAAERTPQQYIKHPNMWLDDNRWEDEIVDPVLDKLNTSPHPITDMVKESLRRKAMAALGPNTSKRLLQ